MRNFFFKKVFGKKVAYCRKPKKRPFRLIKRFFSQTDNFKKIPKIISEKKSHIAENPKRDPLGSLNVFFSQTDNFKKIPKIISEKKSHSAERTQRGDTLVYPLLLETLKTCGLVRDSNPRSTASESLKISWRRS